MRVCVAFMTGIGRLQHQFLFVTEMLFDVAV